MLNVYSINKLDIFLIICQAHLVPVVEAEALLRWIRKDIDKFQLLAADTHTAEAKNETKEVDK